MLFSLRRQACSNGTFKRDAVSGRSRRSRATLGGVSDRKLWHVYLARCSDGTLYCGIARDVSARIRAHDAGTGARYTRGRGPLELLLTRRCRDQGLALRLERAVKRLTRVEKLELVGRPAALARIVRQHGRPKTAGRARSAAS